MNRQRPTLLYLIGLLLFCGVVGGVALLFTSRSAAARNEEEQRRSEQARGPLVRVEAARRGDGARRVELQGEARPFAAVTLYAKVSGYLKSVLVDKGDAVRAGQIVAQIESPELDRQYDAAVADAHYKGANARRAKALEGPGVVPASEADLQAGQAAVAESQLRALGTQRDYLRLRAPFDGTVTARFADPGALVQSAANAQTGALPVVTIARLDRLRVTLYVEQRDAPYLRVGDAAEVVVPGGERRRGVIARRAGELDAKTRTMLVEVDLDNRDGKIVPGSFVTVALSLALPPRIEVPVSALVLGGGKPRVMVVKDGHVSARPVEVADDDGATIAVLSGLREGELVALDLGDRVADGAPVRVVAPPQRADASAK